MVATPERDRPAPRVPGRGPGRAPARPGQRTDGDRPRSPTSSPTAAPRSWCATSSELAHAARARAADAAERRPPRSRRRRRALLHLGHHRAAQGRRAHPPGASSASCAAAALVPPVLGGHECRAWACRSPTSWASWRCSPRRCAGIPVYFLDRFNPDAGARRDRGSAGSPRSSACRRCTACCSRPAPRTATSPRCGSGSSGADVMPADLARRFKSLRRHRHAAAASARSARPPSSRATAWSRWAAAWRPRCRRRYLPLGLGDSLGFPLPGWRFRVVDEDGEEVRPGRVGELQVKGPGVLKGYWGDERRQRGGAHRRRLAAHRRPRAVGSARHRGVPRPRQERGDRPAATRCIPLEVEADLEEHPDVLEAAVLGVPDERFGETVVAAVRPGARRHGHRGRAASVGGATHGPLQGASADRDRRRSPAHRAPTRSSAKTCWSCSPADPGRRSAAHVRRPARLNRPARRRGGR